MKTLILVDIQNDFLPGGALAVPHGDEIIPIVNKLINKFDLVLATQDFHPKGHKSFASTHKKKPGEIIQLGKSDQVLWPDHCVQGTLGSEFPPSLKMEKVRKIFQKGTDFEIDSYSGFFDNDHTNSTGLYDFLKRNKIKEIFLVGLATDYCVKYTAMDALKLGFEVTVIKDACRGIDLHKGDVEKALEEIKKSGGIISSSEKLL
jgi:nicotinamidase/pyrazinamidase